MVAIVLIAVLALTGVLSADRLATIVVFITIIAAIVYFAVILSSKKITKIERRRVYSFIPMFIVSAVFWSLYQQQFTVVTEYSDKQLNRDIFGWEMPVSWVQSINPVFVMILSLVFAWIWTKMGDRQPPTPIKFAARRHRDGHRLPAVHPDGQHRAEQRTAARVWSGCCSSSPSPSC